MPTSLIGSSSKIFQWLIAGLPQELLDDRRSRSGALTLSFILLCNLIASLIFLIIVFFSFDQSPAVFDYGVPMILGCIINYIISGVILVYFRNIFVAGNISLVGPFVCAVWSGWLTGGVFSPMLYLLLIPPVFSSMLGGIRSGFIWCALSLCAFTAFWLNDFFHLYEPLFMMTVDDFPLMQFLLPVTTCLLLMVVVGIYEVNSANLRLQLSQERNVLAFKAAHDPLTGLANRDEFNTQIDMAIASARHSDYPLSLVYMDLDGFKPINDELGHHAGDQVLIAIAARLRHIVRGTDTVARLGGDEFAIILQGVGGRELVNPILQKILDSVGTEVMLEEGGSVTVQASLGIAFLSLDDKGVITGDVLCRQADKAMYLAKKEKNTWRFFDQIESGLIEV